MFDHSCFLQDAMLYRNSPEYEDKKATEVCTTNLLACLTSMRVSM